MIHGHRLINGFLKHQTAVATLETTIAATRENLHRLRTSIRPLFRDENFVNLLRAEGYVTAPASINADDGAGLDRRQIGRGNSNTAGFYQASLGRRSRIRRQSEKLRKQPGNAAGAGLEDSLMLTTLFFYLKSLLMNFSIRKYLSKHDSKTLENLEMLAATFHQSTVNLGVAMNDPLWTFAKAKADLGQLMKAAVEDGPQAICMAGRWGHPSVMVVSIRTWKTLNQNHTAHGTKRRLRRATRKRLSEALKARWARAKKLGRNHLEKINQ